MFAHIAGIPVEETALSFGPIVTVTGGMAALKLRDRIERRRGRRRRFETSRRTKV